MKFLVDENIWDGCYNVFFFLNVDEADKITTVLMLVKDGLLLKYVNVGTISLEKEFCKKKNTAHW